MKIEIREVHKSFGRYRALDGVSLEVPDGELVALLGPSGSGKTTLLRIIAGLEAPDSGAVLFDGQDATRRSLRERAVGFVFQHYALFRHMTVYNNIAFGLKVRPRKLRPSREAIRARVAELLRLVQLEGLANRYPSELSGGQRQRVALARALAIEPKVLLLDEPFGALDARVRQELRRWLRRLHDELGITGLFVTHDQEEALEVADRVVIMSQGRIEQIGTPEEVYDHPATPFVAEFLGSVNRFHGRFQNGRLDFGGLLIEPSTPLRPEAAVVGYVRPHDLELQRTRAADAGLAAEVAHVALLGAVVRVELRRRDTGALVQAELSRDEYRQLGLTAGELVYLRPRRMAVFSASERSAAADRPVDQDEHPLSPAICC